MIKYLLIIIILVFIVYDSFSQLAWSTYLGGDDMDKLRGFKVDSIGNSFVYGITMSENFPTSPGAYLDNFCNDSGGFIYEGFLTKLKSDGSDIIFSTFIGPIFNCFTGCSLLDVDKFGNSYITGNAINGFPITRWISDTTFRNSEYNVFISKINPSGSALIYSTYIGHGGSTDIAVDASGNAFITGYTYDNFYFPTTAGVYDTIQWDIISQSLIHKSFVTKLNSQGTALIYSTLLYKFFYNGNIINLDIDNAGNAFISSLALNSYPLTPVAYDNSYNGGYDLGITKLNSYGSGLIYSTYIGGSSDEQADMIIIDNLENAYITGYTQSSNYPVSPGVYDNSYNGSRDIFLTKLNPIGNSLIFSTFLGGKNDDGGSGLAIDGYNNVYILGGTKSSNFPITSNAYYNTFKNGISTLSILDPSGSNLLFSSYLNYSTGLESCVMALNRNNYIYVSSGMVDNTFRVTKHVYDTSYNGNGDINVTKYGLNTLSPIIQTVQYLEFFPDSCFAITLDTFFIRNTGQSILIIDFLKISGTDSSYFSIISPSNFPFNIFPGDSNKIIVQFNPYNINFFPNDTAGQKTAKISITNNATSAPWQINLSGISGSGGSPIIQSLTKISFPSVICNNIYTDYTFFVHNTGPCPLSLIGSTCTGTYFYEFLRITPISFPVYVKSNDSIKFIIRFMPDEKFGIKTANLLLTNNSSVNPYIINLTARYDSIGFNINNSESDTIIVDFGNICPGIDKDTIITIFNESTTGTTIKIENNSKNFKIIPENKVEKKEDTPLSTKKKKKKK